MGHHHGQLDGPKDDHHPSIPGSAAHQHADHHPLAVVPSRRTPLPTPPGRAPPDDCKVAEQAGGRARTQPYGGSTAKQMPSHMSARTRPQVADGSLHTQMIYACKAHAPTARSARSERPWLGSFPERRHFLGPALKQAIPHAAEPTRCRLAGCPGPISRETSLAPTHLAPAPHQRTRPPRAPTHLEAPFGLRPAHVRVTIRQDRSETCPRGPTDPL